MAHEVIVARISEVEEIIGAERIHVATVLGEKVVVSKDWGVGKVGLLFPVDVQISDEYCKNNNLYRNSDLNIDKTKKGFFDTNRRVRAQPFMKVQSSGFFTEIESMSFIKGYSDGDFTVGSTFDKYKGVDVCKKYISEQTLKKLSNAANNKSVKVVDVPFFEKHVDSAQFKYFGHAIEKGSLLSFHAKVHGTSARMSYTPKRVVYPKWKQYLRKKFEFVSKLLPEFEYEYVVGTRNVVLGSADKVGFHGSEKFRYDVMEIVKPWLDNGMTIYGEIAGYANGSPIMGRHSTEGLKNKDFTKKYGDAVVYSYGCKEHEFRFHIYRITRQALNGLQVDMSQKEMEQWCRDRNLLCTLEVHPQFVYDGDYDNLSKIVSDLTERNDVMTEDFIDSSHPSEGIIIRVDKGGHQPKFYKSKSFVFRVMESSIQPDDIESLS